MMPASRSLLLSLSFLAVMPVTSFAKPDKAGKGEVVLAGAYDVKYDESANNCTNTGMSLKHGSLKIDSKSSDALTVDIERIPLMSGKPSKGGYLKATSKLGPTSIEGLDGKFSVAGHVDDGVLSLVFVAEYYAQKKPLCMQSWNISGLRSADGKPASGK